jgi:hypothetical protein
VRLEHRDPEGEPLDNLPVPLPAGLEVKILFGTELVGWTANGTSVSTLNLYNEQPRNQTCVALALETPLARELARREAQSFCPKPAEWAKVLPGVVPRHRGAGQ